MKSGCNILQFQSLFDIVMSSTDDRQAIERIFGKRRLIKKNYPENTSLQKRAKRFPKSKKSSFGYQQYLMLFLAMTKQSTRRYRVMDLIQNTMQKNGYKGFKLGSCVYEMKVCGGFLFPGHFFRMAPLESVLGRDVKNCRINVEICAGY